jgi:hypothetical protein
MVATSGRIDTLPRAGAAWSEREPGRRIDGIAYASFIFFEFFAGQDMLETDAELVNQTHGVIMHEKPIAAHARHASPRPGEACPGFVRERADKDRR